jgi:predicted Rossmann fold nucleotide-binding protein DprA/Smf involved in DNA uptake
LRYPEENKKLSQEVLETRLDCEASSLSDRPCAGEFSHSEPDCGGPGPRQFTAGGIVRTRRRNKIYELPSSDQAVHIDDIVERSGLNCSEVLATLFNLEMKGIVRQMSGKQFTRVLL